MADADKTLITRAEFDSNINADVGRNQLTFDGVPTDAASFTGIRDITGSLEAGKVTSGRLLISRKDGLVTLIFSNIVLPAAAEGTSHRIAIGADLQSFRPFYTATHDYRINTGGDIVRLAVTSAASVFVQFAKAGLPINTTMLLFTQAGWPNPLPGVADGTPVVL